jgi:DNA polymerase
VTYLYDGQHLGYALPSGRVLCYPFARKDRDGISYAKAAWKPAQDAKEWPRARLWPGMACEQATQATANDVLRATLRELDRRGLIVVLHVHDEVGVECKAEDAEHVSAIMAELMTRPPSWARGLPLAAEGSIMLRYGK